MAEASQRSEALVRSRDVAAAEKLVRETDLIAHLASPERRSEWADQSRRLSRKGLRARV